LPLPDHGRVRAGIAEPTLGELVSAQIGGLPRWPAANPKRAWTEQKAER
jgi:hypothetical protein